MTAPRTPRASSPKRWQSALKRAVVEGIEVRQLQGSGMWIATSATDSNTAYEVSPWECECQAGQFDDPVCKHRAALLLKLGRHRIQPDTIEGAVAACARCIGTGMLPVTSAEDGRAMGIRPCPGCGGTGRARTNRAA